MNDSGIIPSEFKVLVLPDEDEVTLQARRSNIAIPSEYAARYQAGSVTGHIIDVSPAAFSYHDWPEGTRLPQTGDRVVFARYAGMKIKGKTITNAKGHDEQLEYRLINDKDIAGILEY
jgi:co-chaperonin GroES (HSP10)